MQPSELEGSRGPQLRLLAFAQAPLGGQRLRQSAKVSGHKVRSFLEKLGLALSGGYLLGAQSWAFSNWKWPGLSTFALPVLVFALVLLDVQAGQREPAFEPRA